MPNIFEKTADWLFKHLLRPRWGARRALGSFLNQGVSWGAWANNWTDSRYEQVRHFKNWVYIAVDRIATEVAMHQPNVSVIRTPGDSSSPHTNPKNWLKAYQRRKALTPLLSHEQLEPAPHNHPLCRLLRDPNEDDTSYDLWYETAMFLLLTGSAYWWIPPMPVTNSQGVCPPAAIWVLPSHWVWAQHNEQGQVDRYELRPVEGNYVRAYIPVEDVVHFRRKSPGSKVDGYAPQTAGGQWIDTQESCTRSRWFGFRNGIFPGVSVEFDPQVKLPDEADLNRIEARLMARYGGETNFNKPIMVPPGTKLRKLQLTANELQYCESEDQLRDQILALFRVPAACVGIAKNMTYGALTASQADFYTSCINPQYHFLGQQITEKIAVRRYNRSLKVWWEDRTPSDPELQEKSLMTDLAYGATTINEVRQLRGKEPFPQPWADEPWLQQNVSPVSMLLDGIRSQTTEPGGGATGANRATQSDPENVPNSLDDGNEHVDL